MKIRDANKRIELAVNVLALVALVKGLFTSTKEKKDESK